MTLVLGVDGCPGGWCAVALDVAADTVGARDTQVLGSFADVLVSPAEAICVDIPIGLLDRPGRRTCDVEARRLLGRGRASSVFAPPSRRALAFDDYVGASETNFQLTGRHLNKQSFNIAAKVREVDEAMKSGMQGRVLEVHPELCFQALNGHAVSRVNKKTTAGREARWRLLRTVFPDLGPNPTLPVQLKGLCGADDYVDALVCAWTAACVARGVGRRIPSEPEMDEPGLRMEMWLPG
jgi:predicted RNase H-like nuclease